MRFRSGMARLTIVGVGVVELILAGGAYHAWIEVGEAEQRLAALPVPSQAVERGDDPCGATDPTALCDPVEMVRSAAVDSARSDYEYSAATVETKKSELYLLLGFLLAFPLIAALVFHTIFWVGRGFRSQAA